MRKTLFKMKFCAKLLEGVKGQWKFLEVLAGGGLQPGS